MWKCYFQIKYTFKNFREKWWKNEEENILHRFVFTRELCGLLSNKDILVANAGEICTAKSNYTCHRKLMLLYRYF